MAFHADIDAMPDEEVETALGEKFKRSALSFGKTVKEYLKMLVSDQPLPLSKEEIEYGRKVAERLNKK